MMREFLKAFRVAIKTMRLLMAGVASTALVAVRAVDGTISWLWQTVAGSPVIETEAEFFEEPVASVEAPDLTPNDAFHSNLGGLVLRAAEEVLRHGEVRSGDIAAGIATWLQNLDRGDLFELTRHDPMTVGRHTAGVEPILGVAGEPLRTPDGVEDRKREGKRQKLKQQRRLQQEAAAARLREAEVVQASGPSFLPSLAA